MLKVQEWLYNNNLDFSRLEEVLGIKSTFHEDGRVILNYSQFDSPKTDPVVRECRGLVLDKNSGGLVARSFSRFFNLGEVRTEDNKFHWNDCHAEHKEDGSLILVYYWNDEWRVNTRGSFADLPINDSPITWIQLVKQCLKGKEAFFDKTYTYVFELASPYNKVVRKYDEPQLFLLSMFHDKWEVTHDTLKFFSAAHNLETPDIHPIKDSMDAMAYIADQVYYDKTFEGLVLRDVHNHRLKIKSPEYVALHRMCNNNNPCSPKNLIRFVMENETDELLCYFPEVRSTVEEMQVKIEEAWKVVESLWYCYHDLKNQKKFAKSILGKTPFTSILFMARKTGKHPKDFWNEEIVLKMLFGK